MSDITLNMPSLSEMSETQLQAAALFDPVAVAAERVRRTAYETREELYSDLAQAQVILQAHLSVMHKSPATKAIEDSGIMHILKRATATATATGIEYVAPTIPHVAAPPPRGPMSAEALAKRAKTIAEKKAAKEAEARAVA
jgi:hypothetical protein